MLDKGRLLASRSEAFGGAGRGGSGHRDLSKFLALDESFEFVNRSLLSIDQFFGSSHEQVVCRQTLNRVIRPVFAHSILPLDWDDFLYPFRA